MPVKNAEPWLNVCLKSIQNQSFQHWNLYAVDDFSTDLSLQILYDFALKDDRINVLQNTHPGIIAALALGFNTSTESIITRMDADDLMPSNKLENLLNAHCKHKNGIVTGCVSYFSNSKISEGYQRYQNWLNTVIRKNRFYQEIYRECTLASANWMCSRFSIELVGGFENLSYPEDYHLVLKWYEHQIPIFGIDLITHHWREHELRTSRNSSNYNQDAFFNLKIEHFIRLKLTKSSRVVLFGEGLKFKKCKTILNKTNVSFIQVSLQGKNNSIALRNYQPNHTDLVLVCVYPERKEREKLEALFYNWKMIEGENWWYV